MGRRARWNEDASVKGCFEGMSFPMEFEWEGSVFKDTDALVLSLVFFVLTKKKMKT